MVEGEGYRLICGDCRDEDLKGDALIADPPYGVNAVVGGKCFGTSNACKVNEYKPIHDDDRPFEPSHLIDAAPIVVLWGANHYADKLPARARWLVWDKRDGTNSNPLADCEMAWTSDTRPARLFHHRWMGMIRASERGPRLHPSQKPVALMEWVLDVMEVPQGALVVDPYMGCGPLGVACMNTGRRYLGIEIDDDHFSVACKRIAKAAQGRKELLIPA